MNAVNKTLYIPLRGKALVSRAGILLRDPAAEAIWQKEGFPLRGKSASKWLAYAMGMRAAVFDDWTRARLRAQPRATVLHIGCGLDARARRVDAPRALWVDIDLPAVIAAREKYFAPGDDYIMLGADASQTDWLRMLPRGGPGVIVMEGLSMYLSLPSLQALLQALHTHFDGAAVLLDAYTPRAVRLSKYGNPIRDVGARASLGIDDPLSLCTRGGARFIARHSLTPPQKINELPARDQKVFRALFAGKIADGLYRLYEYAL